MRQWLTSVLVLIGAMAALFAIQLCARAEQEWDEDPNVRGQATPPGPYESTADRLMKQFAGPGVTEQGDNARILWRRAMGPHAGYNDMAGIMGPAVPQVIRKDDQLLITMGNLRLYWLTSRGGEICDLSVFNGRYWFPVQHHKVVTTVGQVGEPHNPRIPVGFRAFRADTLPNFVVECPADYAGDSPLYFLGEDKQAQFEVTQVGNDEVDVTTTGFPANFARRRCPLKIQQNFRIFAEGVVLCDFSIKLEGKETYTIREMGLGSTLSDVLYTDLYADCPAHFMSRMGKKNQFENKKFFTLKPHLVLNEHVPYFGASFAFPGRNQRSFSNSLDIVLEQPNGLNVPIVTKPFYDKYDAYSLQYFYSLAWGLYSTPEGKPLQMERDFSYSNTYVLATGSHRLGSRADLPKALRNNLALRRIAWWKNTDQEGKGKSWYPTAEEIKRLSAQGLDVLVLGQGWMGKPGIANQSMGDYVPADAPELQRTIDAAHAHGIRVGLSMRGQDYAVLAGNGDWITKNLRKDFDGVLVEEVNFLASRGVGVPKSVTLNTGRKDNDVLNLDDDHAAASACFLLSRQLRELVGEKGFLLGTSDIGPTAVSLANFDAYIPARSQIDQLNGTLDEFVYNSFLNSCGSAIPVTAGPQAMAYAAGLGGSLVRIIDRRSDLDADLATAGTLWKACDTFNRDQVVLYNGITEESGVVRTEKALGALAVNGQGQCLLVVANPSQAKVAARVTLDGPRLKLKTTTQTLDLAPGEIRAMRLE